MKEHNQQSPQSGPGTTELYKQKAREFGANLVGVVSGKRFRNLTERFPQIPPEAKSAMVIGRRVMRGSLRGVEEGTNFKSTYEFFGCLWVEQQFLPRTVFKMVRYLEEDGLKATPVSFEDIDVKVFAQAAGLGEIGRGGFFLSPEYGHRQRMAVIFINAELESDPEIRPDFCKDCRACLEACPLGAITEGSGYDFKVDLKTCATCKNGAIPEVSERTYLLAAQIHTSDKEGDSEIGKTTDRIAASCGRACMVALENKLDKKFRNKFRKRSIWWADRYGDIHVEKEKK